MSDRPPQSLKELVERVPDGEARLVFQSLVREIKSLERELEKRDQALWTIRTYLQSTYSLTYDGYQSAVEKGLLDDLGVAAPARAQLEVDQTFLARAEGQDDFIEFCRRTFLLVEAHLYVAMDEALARDQVAVRAAWDKAQSRRNRPEPLPQALTDSRAGDLLEASFILIYGSSFPVGQGQPRVTDCLFKNSIPDVLSRYWFLIWSSWVRNKASHRDGQQSALDAVLSQAGLRLLYENRASHSYDAIRSALTDFIRDLRQFVA